MSNHNPRRGGRLSRKSVRAGSTERFKDAARQINRRIRYETRNALRAGDSGADELLERHYRHTADWEAY